jgi:hypothetical protein
MPPDHCTRSACPDLRRLAMSRRQLLRTGVLGTLGFGLSDLLRLQASAAVKASCSRDGWSSRACGL